MIRVLIVDDHQIMRDGLALMLDDAPGIIVAGQASDGREALEFLQSQIADVILMDINMPAVDGIEATATITKLYPDTKVLALTMLDQGSFIQLMLRNGASGYLLKTVGKDELVHAIAKVYEGGRYLAEETTDILLNTVAKQQHASRVHIPSLTRREKEVLKLIAQGLTDTEIASRLYISLTTAKSHRKNLRSKLNARNSAEIVRIALERGMLDAT